MKSIERYQNDNLTAPEWLWVHNEISWTGITTATSILLGLFSQWTGKVPPGYVLLDIASVILGVLAVFICIFMVIDRGDGYTNGWKKRREKVLETRAVRWFDGLVIEPSDEFVNISTYRKVRTTAPKLFPLTLPNEARKIETRTFHIDDADKAYEYVEQIKNPQHTLASAEAKALAKSLRS